MSQQEMGYSEIERDKPGSSYRAYEGVQPSDRYGSGEKLLVPLVRNSLTSGQRLALAIVSLAMIMIMTFFLVGIAAVTQASPLVIAPILFILALFTTAAVIINIVFNRHS